MTGPNLGWELPYGEVIRLQWSWVLSWNQSMLRLNGKTVHLVILIQAGMDMAPILTEPISFMNGKMCIFHRALWRSDWSTHKKVSYLHELFFFIVTIRLSTCLGRLNRMVPTEGNKLLKCYAFKLMMWTHLTPLDINFLKYNKRVNQILKSLQL